MKKLLLLTMSLIFTTAIIAGDASRKGTNGAEEVASFTLISGWQAATDNTFWKLDNVVFQ